jgi:hypothetical protein
MWLDWRKRVSGKPIVDYMRKCGYFAVPKIGGTQTFDLQSGKRGLYMLVDIKYYWDPHDMIESASFQLIGYVGQKPFLKMRFKEYCDARSIIGSASNGLPTAALCRGKAT